MIARRAGDLVAPKLHVGDTIHVLAPSRSLAIISPSIQRIAEQRLTELGLKVVYGPNVSETGFYDTASAEARASDLNALLEADSASGALSVIGGHFSIEVLSQLDYSRFKRNPKVICGYSDITVLLNALFAKTGVVTYHGPHFSSFGMKVGIEYTLEHFAGAVFASEARRHRPSGKWSEDPWFLDQENRHFQKNDGPWIVRRGKGTGTLVGGNLAAFHLLSGTEYLPELRGSILAIEMDGAEGVATDRGLLQRLSTIFGQNGADIRGLLIGRFKSNARIDMARLSLLVERLGISGIPVVANLDFGHTTPCMTLPIGGIAAIDASKSLDLTIAC